MHFLRVIPLIIALFVQALPVPAAGLDMQPKCDITCCTAPGMPCCCVESEQTPVVPSPTGTLPMTGREIVPVNWTVFAVLFPWKIYSVEPTAGFDASVVVIQPHVRLPVLFCTILI